MIDKDIVLDEVKLGKLRSAIGAYGEMIWTERNLTLLYDQIEKGERTNSSKIYTPEKLRTIAENRRNRIKEYGRRILDSPVGDLYPNFWGYVEKVNKICDDLEKLANSRSIGNSVENLTI